MPRTHIPAKRSVCSLDGDPFAVEDGSYNPTAATDETTNLLSEGFGEDVETIHRCTLSLRLVYDGTAPPEFKRGDVISVDISVPGRAAAVGPPVVTAIPPGPSLTGMFRITSMTWPVVNPKGAVKYSMELISQGEFIEGVSAII